MFPFAADACSGVMEGQLTPCTSAPRASDGFTIATLPASTAIQRRLPQGESAHQGH